MWFMTEIFKLIFQKMGRDKCKTSLFSFSTYICVYIYKHTHIYAYV